MWRYSRCLLTLSGLLLLLVAGFLLSGPAGAPPVPAARAAAPQVTPSLTPTPACGPGWTIYPNPAPAGDSLLNGVTALAPNDLWAVGVYTATGTYTSTTLTVHGNGTSWTYVPSPNPPFSKSVLHAVAGVAANDVWAVGEYNGGPSGQWLTLTEHWDGTAWTIVPSPNYVYNNRLYAVTAIASNDVWAVGITGSSSFPHDYALTEHWDGTTWTIVPSPNVTGTPLYGVVAASANDVWAVGGGYTTLPAYGRSYVQHWDGSTWSAVANPANNGSSLHAVTLLAANDIWAVGYTGGFGTGQTLIEHWDGSAWSVVPSPNPGATTNLLYGVSARASNNVWAVGDTNQASGGVKTLTLHWDGSGWFQVATPDSPTGQDQFYAVTANGATGGPVWAAGVAGCTSGCTQHALIARAAPSCLTPVPTWTPTATATPTPACGLTWRGVSSPNLPGGGRINEVAAVSANDIWAVGYYYPNGYIQALTEHWNGSQWSIVPYDPNPGNPSGLYAVAAVASNDVWAVGSGGGTIVMHWDGSSWTRVPSPSPGDLHPLFGVAAVASNDVWAVGWQQTNGVDSTLIEHWNGSTWSVVSSPNVGSYSYLNGVTARAANDIWAVGYSDGPQTLVEHWNGINWSIVASPGGGDLQSLSAVAADDVWAVGCTLYCNQIGAQTLIAHWNGSTWSIMPSPNPFAGNNQLFGVAALATDDVWAVGDSSPNSSPYQALIEHWNGTQWSTALSPPGGALFGLAALAANNIWAGGDLGNFSGGLIMHYNDPCPGSVTPTGTPTRLPTTPSATPTATATCAVGAWSIVPSPNQGGSNILNGLAKVTANDIWAVGQSAGRPLTEHWNGSMWSIVPSPTITGSLRGVAVVGSNDVWAVGEQGGNTLSEHWDGSSWTQVPIFGSGPLNGVAAVAANDVWAVGGYPGAPIMGIWHWNGSSWSSVCCTDVGLLESVAAVASNDVWAVGYLYPGCGGTRVMHWNGTNWSNVSPYFSGPLYGVTAVAANDVWVVGSNCGSAATLHWNGTSWSYVTSPNVSGTLYSVTAVAANDVWAVGSYTSGGTLTEHWDGSSWSIVPSPNLGAGSVLNAVAAVAANNIWAVGAGNSGASTLVLLYSDACTGSATPTRTPTAGASNTPTRTNTPLPLTPTCTATLAAPSPTVGRPSPTLAPTQTPGGSTATPVSSATPPPSASPCAISFTDVHSTDYFYTPVQYLYCRGVLSGYGDNTFRPYANTTRGQMVKIVVLGFGIAVQTPAIPTFSDVPPSHPFYAFIETAAAHDIVSGYADGTFRPQNNVTRGQLSKIDVVAAGWTLLNPAERTFEDVLPNTAFYEVVETAACHGIISGYICGGPGEPCASPARPYFRQNNDATRGQIAKIVYLSVTTQSSCQAVSSP